MRKTETRGSTFEESKGSFTPVRYDFNLESFERIHPVSHFHFGFMNQTRIGTDKILVPISFVLFILRQFYPKSWSKLLNIEDSSQSWFEYVRDRLNLVPSDRFNDDDELVLK